MKKGFTLIELLVIIAIIATLTVGATQLYKAIKNHPQNAEVYE